MSSNQLFNSAVDAPFNVIGCSRYFRVADKRKKIRDAVFDESSDRPEFSVCVPPASFFVLYLPVASLRQEAMVFCSPAFPEANPAAFLSSCANGRQLFDKFPQVLPGKSFGMECQFGKRLSQDVDQTSLERNGRPMVFNRCK